ncbi:MAG: c-type cytochrome [Rhodoplanes sp.]|uniref:c-type cytochrome n=1 Tax=Rhodoplanes sp. TaxID=1968906 RepID=UPI0017FA671C|nr:c-type cytochrome [Rhodoplanes sp.]NVO16407.1 c-type cytochrome [Rhodoplanes sp.]
MIRFGAGLIVCLLATTIAAHGQGAGQESAADGASEGRTLFRTKTCVACHGRDGSRAIQNYPDLAGQDARYMIQQMTDIASGARMSGPDPRGFPRTQGMKDIMHLVTQEQRASIADYLSKLPAPKPRPLDPAVDSARLAEGKQAYAKGGCIACHGPDGSKPVPSYPYIGGMKREYLVLQITEIKAGVRRNSRVRSMLPFASKLDDAKIAAIADYLSQIKRNPD